MLEGSVAPASMTLLDAVNRLLRAIKEAPVSSLVTADTNEDTESALQTLTDTLREVLDEGWNFNTEPEAILDPASDGTITLPANVLRFDTAGKDAHEDLVARKLKVYDRRKRTTKIGRSITAALTFSLPFDDLPQAAKWYVTVKAARRFAGDEADSTNAYRFTQRDEEAAHTALLHADAESTDSVLPYVNPFFARMLRR